MKATPPSLCDNVPMHLFVDISSHGFGHLAITAPVLRQLHQLCPDLRLTVRSGLSHARLRSRLPMPFTHLASASDFGYVMHDALNIDLERSAAAYRAAHAEWTQRVDAEAGLLRQLQADLVFSNVSYLPLAGAAIAGIPAVALCSLNWCDLFRHYFGDSDWARPIHQQITSAYRSARHFLITTPGMPMPDLANRRQIGLIAGLGQRRELGFAAGERVVLIAMGGVELRLPVENWPRLPGIRWLVPESWQCRHPDAVCIETYPFPLTDLLCSVDAVLTKPGYGTFTEAACNGTPVLYQHRHDWPEQECLIDWLHQHARAGEVSAAQVASGKLDEALVALWSQTAPRLPAPDGSREAAAILHSLLA